MDGGERMNNDCPICHRGKLKYGHPWLAYCDHCRTHVPGEVLRIRKDAEELGMLQQLAAAGYTCSQTVLKFLEEKKHD